MRNILGIIAACSMWPGTQALAAAPKMPEQLTGGQWNLDYSEDSCKLARIFGEGPNQVQLLYEFYSPGGEYQLVLAGKRFSMLGRDLVTVGYGPGLGDLPQVAMNGAKLGDLPALVGYGPRLDNGHSDLIDGLEPRGPATEQQEAAARELIVTFKNRTTILLLGSMVQPMRAVRGCLDELVTHWGLDPAELQTIQTMATPRGNPANWLQPEDYPSSSVRQGLGAIVHFRLTIGVNGEPTACSVQSSTQGPEFAEVTCRLLMVRAQFTPARNRAGEPVRSYYIGSVRWAMDE